MLGGAFSNREQNSQKGLFGGNIKSTSRSRNPTIILRTNKKADAYGSRQLYECLLTDDDFLENPLARLLFTMLRDESCS